MVPMHAAVAVAPSNRETDSPQFSLAQINSPQLIPSFLGMSKSGTADSAVTETGDEDADLSLPNRMYDPMKQLESKGSESQLSLRPVLELDLDYLEDPHNRRRNRATTPLKEFSPDSVDLVKVVLLGAPCVGKTSIIQQFVWNEFDDKYVTTERKHTYYPSVIINDRLYELKISDIPVIPYFPVNAYYEWTDYRFYGLRSATAYILVFDLSNMDTFHYVRTLREQMIESRDMSDVPLVVVGNKQDLVGQARPSGSPEVVYHKWSESSRQRRDDIVSLVTKHWKCAYIECSAKYNWKVMQLFKEVMEMIDSSCTIQQQGEDFAAAVDGALDDNGKPRCNIL